MAIGDKAAAKNLTVYAGTQDRRLGYQNDNKRGDELAEEIDARTAADTTERNARTADVNAEASARASADNLKLDKTYLKIQKSNPGHLEGRVWISWS